MKRLLYILLTVSAVASAQKPVRASMDTLKNKIGAEFKLTIKASADTSDLVVFPTQKMFGALEVIRDYPADTARNGARYELVKKYGLTQFDSGRYTVPPLTVMINRQPFLTDTFSLQVANVKVDTLKQKMYDIKDIVHVSRSFDNWWLLLPGLVLLVIIGYGIYYLVRRQQKKQEELAFKTPIEKANSLLQQLERKELWQRGEVKEYYSELTDIARTYIEEAIHIPAMESTTSELIVALQSEAAKKNMSLSQETIENLEKVLRHADLVKFAKSRPLEFEIFDDRTKIEKAITTLDASIPEELPEEQIEQKKSWISRYKDKQVRRIIAAVAILVAMLFGTAIYFSATRGFGYVRDNVFGHSTKALLESEWVSSEYGNPGVFIETPRVLRRRNAEEILPKETMAMLKDFQIFSDGTVMNKFFVMVSTNTYKTEQTPDLKVALEAGINLLETQGFRNIIFKQEEFNTKAGISGVKGSGTAIRQDPITKENVKVYYEVLLFGQQNGLQQIMIMHEDDDPYAKEVTERILQSVELKINQGS